MSSDDRKQLMARLRGLQGRERPPAEALQRQLQAIGRAPAAPLLAPDLAVSFLANVLRNQGSIDCVDDRRGSVDAIARFLYERYRSKKLAVSRDPRLAALPWRDAGLLPRFEAAEDGELAALSYARLGIAETGAVVQWSSRAESPRNFLLPETQVVLVDGADLVATVEDAWQVINEEAGRPRGIHFIAGPSSTADISMQLVKGAHGPRHWHVILLGEHPAGRVQDAYRAAGLQGPAA